MTPEYAWDPDGNDVEVLWMLPRALERVTTRTPDRRPIDLATEIRVHASRT